MAPEAAPSGGLRENTGVRQRPDEGYRRWFLNRTFELIVWYDAPGRTVTGFQLCLDRRGVERAFTWTTTYASNHFVSEPGTERGAGGQPTGILKGAGRPVTEAELDKLIRERGDLEVGLLDLVVGQIRAHRDRQSARPT